MRANLEHSITYFTDGKFSILDFGIFFRKTKGQMSQLDILSAICRMKNHKLQITDIRVPNQGAATAGSGRKQPLG